MFDKYKNFYQNEKSLKEKYYKMRVGIFETFDLDPNKTIYKIIVSSPSFLLINSISSYYLIKNHNKNFRNNILGTKLKLIGRLVILTFFNYNVFYRSYLNEYPVVNKFYIDNKFERLANSLVNPVFVMEKDFLILLIIFIPCLIFNKNKVDDMNKIKKEKLKQDDDKNNIKPQLLDEKNVENPSDNLQVDKEIKPDQPSLIEERDEDSNKYSRSGKFI